MLPKSNHTRRFHPIFEGVVDNICPVSTLEEFYKEIEAEDCDRSVESCEELKKRFEEKRDELLENGEKKEARMLEAEREALTFIKHPQDKKGDRLEPLIRRKVKELGRRRKKITMIYPI